VAAPAGIRAAAAERAVACSPAAATAAAAADPEGGADGRRGHTPAEATPHPPATAGDTRPAARSRPPTELMNAEHSAGRATPLTRLRPVRYSFVIWSPDTSVPKLTLEEQQSAATYVGLLSTGHCDLDRLGDLGRREPSRPKAIDANAILILSRRDVREGKRNHAGRGVPQSPLEDLRIRQYGMRTVGQDRLNWRRPVLARAGLLRPTSAALEVDPALDGDLSWRLRLAAA
jgi:hypothetical protein